MDHSVPLARFREELLNSPVRQTPVILGIGNIVENGKIVCQISARIAVKGLVTDQVADPGGIRGLHGLDVLGGVIFLQAAVHPARNKLYVCVNSFCHKDRGDQDAGLHQAGEAIAAPGFPSVFSLFRSPSCAFCPGRSRAERCDRNDHGHSQDHLCQRALMCSQHKADCSVDSKTDDKDRSFFKRDPHELRNHNCCYIPGQQSQSPDPAVCRIGKSVQGCACQREKHQQHQSRKSEFQVKGLAGLAEVCFSSGQAFSSLIRAFSALAKVFFSGLIRALFALAKVFSGLIRAFSLPVQEQQKDTDQADRAEAHAGPVVEHGIRSESDKGFRDTFVI